jgi:hypothetical protein
VQLIKSRVLYMKGDVLEKVGLHKSNMVDLYYDSEKSEIGLKSIPESQASKGSRKLALSGRSKQLSLGGVLKCANLNPPPGEYGMYYRKGKAIVDFGNYLETEDDKN